MGYRHRPTTQLSKPGTRGRSLLDLFFPDWRQACDRRRKAVAAIFLLAFVAVLLSVLARRFGWDPVALLFER